LNLAVFREVNPRTGRWDSQDPLGFGAGDSDLYRYVGNDPTGAIDPDGLDNIFEQEHQDWSQYQRLYENGEISWWEWVSTGLFRPSDVPVYTRGWFGKRWRKGDLLSNEFVDELPPPLVPGPPQDSQTEVKIGVISIPGPLLPDCATPGLCSPGRYGNACVNALEHFKKHRLDFGAVNALDYRQKALEFFSKPPPGTQGIIRTNGQYVLYEQATETFAIYEADGTPVTLYKPKPGIGHKYPTNQDYFNAQNW
jgi:hypothetical protein